MNCPSLEMVAAWVLDELPEQEGEAFEGHYFACASCFAHAQRMQRLRQQLETSLPPMLTRERHRTLEGQHAGLPSVHVQPGQPGTIRLGARTPIGVWIMHCDLTGVARVDFEGGNAGSDPYATFADVPFDAERGQVVMPCHLHYRAMSADPQLHVRLISAEPQGPRLLGEYILNHVFENV